jgi:hypothetical protein
MTPNVDQILSIVRWLLSVGGPLGALLVARGMPAGDVTALQGSIIAVIGAAPPVISFVWGLFAHTNSSKIAAVAAMPDVEKIVVQPQATDGVGAALADPTQTKVVSR